MKRIFVVSCAVLLPILVAAQGGPTSGHLVLIGGGEKPPEAMRKFVELAGCASAPVVVIPTASEDPDTPAYYLDLFRNELGCTDVSVLEIRTREDAGRPDYAAAASAAGGIFFAGGDQSRITTAILETPVGEAIAQAFGRGAVIGGTSAGTACQSPLMITGEGDFTVIRSDNVEVVPGLGFFRGVIVDQHFIARQRSNRLVSVVLEHPEMVGVGIDEDTAVWVRPDGTFDVMGSGSVMVLDARNAIGSRIPGANGKDLLGVRGLRVHVLVPGQHFDLAGPAAVD